MLIFYSCLVVAALSDLEVAVTGTAEPVMMSIAPEISIDFGPCPVGDHMNRPCTLKNSSTVLPIIFHFRRIAHFIPYPQHGTIQPGDSMDIVLSYKPAQMGETDATFELFLSSS